MKSKWRVISAEIIYKILKANPGKTDKEIKAIISEAYPFGERKYHPYKIWLNEVKKWMELRNSLVL